MIKKCILLFFFIVTVLFLILLAVYLRVTNYNIEKLHTTELVTPSNDDVDTYQLAKDLVAQMSLREKVDQMYGEKYVPGLTKFLANWIFRSRFPHIYVGGNKRLGIPPWVLSDGPRGARVMDHEVHSVTTFPVSMARGASWNPQLEYQVNQVISAEMRANHTNYAATPCINLLRHPGWGRAQETYGEDPWLLGEMGVAAVKGIEYNNVMACPKHFAVNSIENSRFIIDVEVDDRTLHEVYLPHFKKTIQKGRPASIMSAYNQVNGAYCSSNKTLLTEILRNQWGFEGFVSTDWFFGQNDCITAIKAGLNVEMPFQQYYTYKNIKEAIDDGQVTMNEIDDIVIKTLAVRLKYAIQDDQENFPKRIIAQEEHINLAREVAEESIVLLKNENILPLSKLNKQNIAVIGRIADKENTGDEGSSNCSSPYVVTPLEGIKESLIDSGSNVYYQDGSDLEAAVAAAKEADQVVLVVGYTREDEGEHLSNSLDVKEKVIESAEAGYSTFESSGGDREDLRLLSTDIDLINEISAVHPNLVVVYVGGSAIDLSDWIDKVSVLVFGWYGGIEGGTALANVLFGDVNPSGKLPFSIARSQQDYPLFTPYAKKIKYDYYHGYTLLDKEGKEPVFPFGYGMSYSDISISNLRLIDRVLVPSDTIRASIDVTNNSDMAGKEVVQLYVGFENSQVDRPVKLLRDFQKISIAPNSVVTVHLKVATSDLAWYNPATQDWEVENMEYQVYVGTSSSAKDLLKDSITIGAPL